MEKLYDYDIEIVLLQNQRDALISQIYFWNRNLHVSDSFSVHHQESSTMHTEIGICHTGYADCLLAIFDITFIGCFKI
jgi:hypothetical protein